jgi:hypothetical protein
VGYLISAAEGQTSVNLTDSEWRALIYVASLHGFSAPHLRLEGEDETLEVDGTDAEGLRSALGKALEARLRVDGVRASPWRPPSRNGGWRRRLFTQRRGRVILRTSPFGHSANFAFTGFSEVRVPARRLSLSW